MSSSREILLVGATSLHPVSAAPGLTHTPRLAQLLSAFLLQPSRHWAALLPPAHPLPAAGIPITSSHSAPIQNTEGAGFVSCRDRLRYAKGPSWGQLSALLSPRVGTGTSPQQGQEGSRYAVALRSLPARTTVCSDPLQNVCMAFLPKKNKAQEKGDPTYHPYRVWMNQKHS